VGTAHLETRFLFGYNLYREFEWDENKRLSNIRKHGIDFVDIPVVFEGDTLTVEDDRFA
jgi:uncharacterized DUF497 family protein